MVLSISQQGVDFGILPYSYFDMTDIEVPVLSQIIPEVLGQRVEDFWR